ncbi:MAG: hypothetical protein H6969_07170 [Gammaproteobacteria bacterium]|nr:hypothetical protein [Gammaproteobacteria bacterium]MCP5458975.1 hypothetical protein [Gammaproteobacteria bacterium]
MNRKIVTPFASSLSVAALLAPSLAGAVDFAFQPRLEGGFMYYEFESQPATLTVFDNNGLVASSSSVSGFKFNDVMPMLGAGFTVFADRFFFDISGQKAFNGSDSDDFNSFIFGTGNSLIPVLDTSLNLDADFDRYEYAISAGYAVTDSWSVFAGYKYAKSKFDVDRVGTIDLFQPVGPTLATYSDEFEFAFKQDGPFIGTTYGWQINQGAMKGLLSANIAVAFLDGEIKDQKVKNAVAELDGVQVPFEDQSISPFKGDTVGFTFGVGWKGFTPVEGLTYSLGINGYQYDFSADEKGVSDVKETQINFRAGISYTF